MSAPDSPSSIDPQAQVQADLRADPQAGVQAGASDQVEPHGSGLSGKWLVAGTLSLFLVIPVVTYLAWLMTQSPPLRVELDYDQRADWFMQPVKPRPLTYDMFVAGETGKKYRRTAFMLDPDAELAVLRCVKLAQRDDFFESIDTRDRLRELAPQPEYGFYPAYLLASWFQVNNQPDLHLKWIRVAYDRAGGALAQRLVDRQGQAVAGYRIPPVAIAYDRVVDGERNATLTLVYPAPITEPSGYVYLPTYRSVYRLTDPRLPLGVDPGMHPIGLTLLPQPALGRKVPNWFSVPDGAVGQFKDAVVAPAP